MAHTSNLIDAARKHLGLSTSAPATCIPKFFIDDLRRHLVLRPNEVNFRVTLQPNVGFGTVTCLKDGCNQTIPLTRRVGVADGGKAAGFGSLSAFKRHLSDHRLLSMSARINVVPKEVVKQQSLDTTAKSEARTTSQTTTSSGSGATGNAKGLLQNKALTENVPRKRPRGADLESLSENVSIVPASTSGRQVTKKIKTDFIKNPLSSVTNTSLQLEAPGAMTNSMPPNPFQHVHATTSLWPAQSWAAPVGSHDEQDSLSERDAADSDSSSDDDEDMPNVADFLSRIGVTAPPLVENDAIDGNGDYYGRGRDLFHGPRASRDDFEKFLIQAGNADVFDGNERVEDALKYLGLKTLHEPLPGMEVNLMAHQVMGVKWMVEKEKNDFKGGCLADEMGLGKTIQIIAMMLKNRPTSPDCKTTLIITPLSLLDQWQTEIELKTNCGITCLVYHGPSKTTSKKKLLQHDVVLTTFSTLSNEWPDFENEMKKKKKAKKNGESFVVSDDEEDMKDFTYRSQKRKQKAGLLFQVEFFRIVLDEAQNVRNRRTRVSRAVTDIQATYRWCLTGTPIVNTLADAYGYVRFLKIRPWYDWDQFNDRVTRHEKKRPDLAIIRLHAIMSTFLLRRQKDTMMDGKPIIDLPAKEVKLIKLEFSKEERDIYKMVEAHSQAVFNRYLRAGTVLKNYHQVLVLLLRLRQICSHASLISEGGDAYVQPDEVGNDFQLEFATELSRARRLVSEEFVARMKAKYKNEALARMETEKLSADASIEEEDCPICFDAMTEAVITACSHVFCRECIVNFINTRQANAGDAAERGCPCCRNPLDIQKLFSRSAFEPTDKDLNPESSTDSDVEMLSDDDEDYYSGKGKGKAVMRPKRLAFRSKVQVESDEDEDMSDFIVESDEDEDEKDARRAVKLRLRKKRVNIILDSDDDTPEEKAVLFGIRKEELSPETVQLLPRFLPSSKMKYMMNEIERISRTKPDEKILIVSQWTACLTLVSNYLTENCIPHVKYQGDMNRTKREQAVKVFMSKEKARIMLLSLKCGGVGLNLTRANNVISLDLGWSMSVESQAFDRLHRLGQTRKVLVQRVVIADTVEDRILQLQERKQKYADGTLGEGSGKKMGKLTVKELANLFGLDAYGRVLHD